MQFLTNICIAARVFCTTILIFCFVFSLSHLQKFHTHEAGVSPSCCRQLEKFILHRPSVFVYANHFHHCGCLTLLPRLTTASVIVINPADTAVNPDFFNFQPVCPAWGPSQKYNGSCDSFKFLLSRLYPTHEGPKTPITPRPILHRILEEVLIFRCRS